jgi:hypothetical protein
MPFVRGRFYMNPAMGEALEEARARAEEGNAAHGSEEESTGHDSSKGQERDGHGRFRPGRHGEAPEPGPVHRMEIEHAEGGFVTRVHRAPQEGAHDAREAGDESGANRAMHCGNHSTHVFTNAHELAEFVREELSRHHKGSPSH